MTWFRLAFMVAGTAFTIAAYQNQTERLLGTMLIVLLVIWHKLEFE